MHEYQEVEEAGSYASSRFTEAGIGQANK